MEGENSTRNLLPVRLRPLVHIPPELHCRDYDGYHVIG